MFSMLLSVAAHAITVTSDDICKQLAITPGNKDLLAQYKAAVWAESNSVSKVHHVVTYCLGCYFTGQMAEGDALRQSVLEKFPSNPDAELLASKNLTDACDQCNGTGKQDSPCRRCNNSGQCNICNGSGQKQYQNFDNRVDIRKCPSCNGTGKCKDCSGTGQTKTFCLRCSGKGTVFSKEQVEKLYVSLLNPDAPATVMHTQVSDVKNTKLSMTDTEAIMKAENCQMTDMSIEEASNLLVKIHQITSSMADNETIKVGGNEYAGFQIKAYEEWLSEKVSQLKGAAAINEQSQLNVSPVMMKPNVEKMEMASASKMRTANTDHTEFNDALDSSKSEKDLETAVLFIGVIIIVGGIILFALRNTSRNIGVAYFLWLFGCFGMLGLHRFYCRDTRMGLTYIITGGLFVIGSIRDLFMMPELVKVANLPPEQFAVVNAENTRCFQEAWGNVGVAFAVIFGAIFSRRENKETKPKGGMSVGDWGRTGVLFGLDRDMKEKQLRVQEKQLEELQRQNRLKEEELRRRK